MARARRRDSRWGVHALARHPLSTFPNHAKMMCSKPRPCGMWFWTRWLEPSPFHARDCDRTIPRRAGTCRRRRERAACSGPDNPAAARAGHAATKRDLSRACIGGHSAPRPCRRIAAPAEKEEEKALTGPRSRLETSLCLPVGSRSFDVTEPQEMDPHYQRDGRERPGQPSSGQNSTKASRSRSDCLQV